MTRRSRSSSSADASKICPRLLLLLAVILSLIGLFFVFEASVAESYTSFGEPYHFLRQQSIWFVIGWILLIVARFIPIKFWQKTAWIWYSLILLLLISTLVPGIGVEINGARRWINLLGQSIQPIEFFKFATIVFFSSWLFQHQRLGPMLFFSLVPAVIVLLQPDMGSLLILLSIIFGLYFLAGGSLKLITILGLTGSLLLGLAIITSSYRLRRLTTFFNPEADPLGASFHIRQITLALGSGGWLGQGLGNSRQKFSYIPEASSDSIFAIVAEEVGFLGSLIIIGLILSFIYLASKIALNQSEKSFASLLAFGIVIWIAAQTLLNLSAVAALVPLTGLPLPFFSYGGSSLVTVLFATGVLLRIAREKG